MPSRSDQRRYRRCPACATVSQASAFRRAPMQKTVFGSGVLRICPACGEALRLDAFTRVERPEPGQESTN